MEVEMTNISLQELSEIENLNLRTRNICDWNGLIDLLSILEYYYENNDFLKLRNCGRKSNNELINLCLKYQEFFVNPQEFSPPIEKENFVLQKIESLTVRQKKILNYLISSKAKELSVRSLNGLNSYLNSNLSLRELMPILIDEDFNIKNLRNIGEKSEKELCTFFSHIRELIDLISIFDNDVELTIEVFNSYLIQKFNLTPSIISEIWKGYDISNGLPLFKTCSILLNHEILFDKRETIIFNKGLNYNNSSGKENLDKISNDLGLTRERTRQIRNIIIDKIPTVFSFIKNLEFEALNLYGLDTDSDLIILNEKSISEINEREQNSFNSIFVNKLLSILLSNSFSLIGNEENIICNKTFRTDHNWKNTYLIKKDLVNQFDFDSFLNDVNKRLSERIEEDYSFHFESYLYKFRKGESTNIIDRLIPITEHILFNEFELSIDIYDQITFKRKTKKQVTEYVYEVLKKENKPLTVYEIFDLIEQKYPNTTKSAEALRGSCQRDVNLIYFGRSSTYGLKIWEFDNVIKGGTMHDISEEYLSQFDQPKHIDDIVEYVSNYRQDVTSKNLLYNLKSAEYRRFAFFKNQYIGLISKNYGSEFTKNVNSKFDQKAWDESFNMLEEFVTQNHRLPRTTGNDSEQRLYRFFHIQLRKASKSMIDEIKMQRLQKFVERINYSKEVRTEIKKNSFQSYDDLKSFISTNGRLPKARSTNSDEKKLYSFYYRQSMLFQKKTLSEKWVDNYIAIQKLIMKYYEH